MIPIKLKQLHENAVVPTYATDGSGCFDLYAATIKDSTKIGTHVECGFPVTCGTGLAFEIPEEHVMLIFSRSGHGFKSDVRLANCTGVIDADYRGEVAVKLTSDDISENHVNDPLFVKPGDRIAQALVIKAEKVQFLITDELSETARGAGGFGSTGS